MTSPHPWKLIWSIARSPDNASAVVGINIKYFTNCQYGTFCSYFNKPQPLMVCNYTVIRDSRHCKSNNTGIPPTVSRQSSIIHHLISVTSTQVIWIHRSKKAPKRCIAEEIKDPAVVQSIWLVFMELKKIKLIVRSTLKLAPAVTAKDVVASTIDPRFLRLFWFSICGKILCA